MGYRVNKLSDFSSQGLHELRMWMETWFVASKRVNGGGGAGTEVTWEDVGAGAAMALDTFALTSGGGGLSITDTGPTFLDETNFLESHFTTSTASTFAANLGRARILVPGMYVIACQVPVSTMTTLPNDTYVSFTLVYKQNAGAGSEVGYSIETPYMVSGIDLGGGEQVIGMRFLYPAGVQGSYDIALQRLHPISLINCTFPVEIQPQFYTSDDTGKIIVPGVSVWGWRLGDNLDAYHSD